MNWVVEHRENRAFVTIKTAGTFSIEDHVRMIEDIVTREFWKPGTDIFFDHRNMQFGKTDIELMRQATANHKKYDKLIGNGRAAILMKSLTDFGRGRQFELLSSDKISAKLRIFLEEEQAVDWLSEK